MALLGSTERDAKLSRAASAEGKRVLTNRASRRRNFASTLQLRKTWRHETLTIACWNRKA
jgi:hypothetical protein